MDWRSQLLVGLVALTATVDVSLAEFVELQRAGDHDLRRRFALPPTCEPAVSAMGLGAKVRVTVTCVDDEHTTIEFSDERPR